MRISVIGTGYVGLVTGLCLADLGNNVICMDVDKEKISKLKRSITTLYEPGVDELLKKNLKEKRILFTTDITKAVRDSDIIFIAVGTPPRNDGQADMSAVYKVAKWIGENINAYKIIINKSTMPVGSSDEVEKIIKKNLKKNIEFDVVSNPEFLREGSAVADFRNPDRIVIGANNNRSAEMIRHIYAPLNAKIIITDVKSAEIIKYGANAFLATKISFINEIANLCAKVGANINKVAEGIGSDKRIGEKFLNSGIGYGGSCFPKDTLALVSTAKKLGYNFKIVKSAIEVNKFQRILFCNLIKKNIKPLKRKKLAIWGLSYKPDTDDMRDAPSIDIINFLLKNKVNVKVFDPAAILNAKKIWEKKIEYGVNVYDTVSGCDGLIIITEWNQFKQADLLKVKNLLKVPIIIDGRGIYESDYINKLGIKYITLATPQ